MTQIAELNEKHAALIKQVREIRDAHQDQDMPADKAAEMEHLLDEADGVKAQLEALVSAAEAKRRLDDHAAWATQSAGQLPGMGTPRPDDGKWLPGVSQKDGAIYAGVGGREVKLFSAAELETRPALKATLTPEYRAAFDGYLRGKEYDAKALSEGTDTAGGFLVPVDFLAQLITRLPGVAVVEDLATVVTTTRDRVEIPRVKKASSDVTMYSSAVKFTMVAETPSSATETEPVFEQMALNVYTAQLFTKLSRNWAADAAFDVTSYLAEEYRRAAMLGKDDRFLTGTGVGEPLGLVNDPDIASVNSGDANLLTADGIKNLVYAVPAQYQANTTLVLSLDALKAIRKLKDGSQRYLWDPGNGGLVGGMPPTIEGRPYRVTDFLDAVAAGNKPIILGDFRNYWVVNRAGMSVQVLREKYAESNQDAYLAFLRFTGGVAVPEAFRTQTVAA